MALATPAPIKTTPTPAQALNTALVATDATLDQVLAAPAPVLLLLWDGDSLRSDLKIEWDKILSENNRRMQIVKINTQENPRAAERFEVGKHPVIVGWHNGAVVVRRNRPWGTDARAIADQLTALAPAPVVPATPAAPLVTKKQSAPVVVTDKMFEQTVINSDIPVLVDFWATWCGPCKQIAPILQKLAAEFAGQILVAKVDVDANPALSSAFGIQSIPTLMFVKNHKIVGQQAGALPEHILRDTIKKLIALVV